MTTLGSKVVPESSLEKLEGGLNPTIISEDCEEEGYGAPSTPKHHPYHQISLSNLFLSTAAAAAEEEAPPPPPSPLGGVEKENGKGEIREEEPLSYIEDSSISAITSTPSLSSIASSSASSSTHSLLRNSSGITLRLVVQDSKQPLKPHNKKIDHKKDSFASLLLWPFKKVKDAYMKCMMELEAAGDLSGLAQGSTFATSCKYFPKRF